MYSLTTVCWLLPFFSHNIWRQRFLENDSSSVAMYPLKAFSRQSIQDKSRQIHWQSLLYYELWDFCPGNCWYCNILCGKMFNIKLDKTLNTLGLLTCWNTFPKLLGLCVSFAQRKICYGNAYLLLLSRPLDFVLSWSPALVALLWTRRPHYLYATNCLSAQWRKAVKAK